jgi:hypothetical protein
VAVSQSEERPGQRRDQIPDLRGSSSQARYNEARSVSSQPRPFAAVFDYGETGEGQPYMWG